MTQSPWAVSILLSLGLLGTGYIIGYIIVYILILASKE
jgi:hypothetical protein